MNLRLLALSLRVPAFEVLYLASQCYRQVANLEFNVEDLALDAV